MTQPVSFNVHVQALHADAKLPLRGTTQAAGADLHCLTAFTLQPGERQSIRTGIAVAIPPGFYGRIAPRSGWAVKHGIDTLAGVIDADYRGEILVALINLGQESFTAQAGDRIAQLIIEQAAPCGYEWSTDLSATQRGAGGFGSTGR